MASEYSRYLKRLYKEYCNSLGIFKIDYRRMFDNLPFRMWLNEYKNKLRFFRYCLAQSGVYRSDIILELEKGFYDTIIKPDDFTYILTEYSKAFSRDVRTASAPSSLELRKPINGELLPYKPRNLEDKKRGISLAIKDTRRVIDIFSGNGSYVVAHNPYNGKLVTTNLGIANENGFNISLGIHGNLSDQDRERKLDNFQEMVNTLEIPNSQIDFYRTGNNYAYIAKK